MTLIAKIFEQDPESIAVSVGDVEIPYGQFCEDIDVLAYWLRGHGVGKGTRLALDFRGDRSYWTWVLHLASLRVGAWHASVNADGGTLQRAASLGVDARITSEPGTEALTPGVHVVVFEPKGLLPLSEQLGVDPRRWDDVGAERSAARIALTSGTTGTPRALRWDHGQMLRRVEQIVGTAGISLDTRLYAAIGLMTTGGFRYPLATWRAGGSVIRQGHALEVDNPSRKVAERSNLMIASPINLANHLRLLPEVWPGREERDIIVLGGRLPAAVRDEALRRACSRIAISYGSTESGTVAGGDAGVVDRHPGAVGFVHEGAEVEVVDRKGRPLPAGRTGVLRIRAEAMCTGYEDGGDAPGARSGFHGGWFYPGDLAILFEDGLLAIAGRISEAVNIGGVKIAPADIEGRLGEVAGLDEACVVPVSLAEKDFLAVVAVVAADADLRAIEREVGVRMPKGCPFRMVRARGLPRNAMGKLQRRLIADRVTAALAQGERKERVDELRHA